MAAPSSSVIATKGVNYLCIHTVLFSSYYLNSWDQFLDILFVFFYPDCLHIFSTLVCVWVWVESLILYEKSFKGYHFLVTTNFIIILIFFIILFSLLLYCELLNIKLQKKRMKNITRETEIPECKGGNFFFSFIVPFIFERRK